MEISNNKIYWIEAISSQKYGGTVYSEKVKKVLAESFDLEVLNIEARHFKNKYLKYFEWYFKAVMLKRRDGLVIIDNSCSAIPVNLTKKGEKSIALVYHIDSSELSLFSRWLYFILERIFLRNIKKADAVVTISDYWKSFFLKRGFSKVLKIYYPMEPVDISEEEVISFKKKYDLEKKPILYIGNCQKAKGAVNSYNALKELDVHLISSGKKQVNINALNLDLSHRDYLKLLKASSVVITMSRFREGWCITAAEAMLLMTPVIGSGLGGMRELLEGGEQIVCEDFKNLKEKVENILDDPKMAEEIGEKGFVFVSQFKEEKFKNNWLNIINEIYGK